MGKVEEQKVVSSTVDVESRSPVSPDSSQEDLVKPITTWKSYVWDTWELPKNERWLLFKVDAFVLTFASVRYTLLLIHLLLFPDALILMRFGSYGLHRSAIS